MAWMIVGVSVAITFAATSGGSSSGSGGPNAHSTAARDTHCGIGDVRAVHDQKFGAIVAGSSKRRWMTSAALPWLTTRRASTR
jgi:hypothetical protein